MVARKFQVIASVLALSAVLGGCSSSEEREAKYIKRGISAFETGQFAKARIEFKNALAIKPTDSEALYRLGTVDEAEGDLNNAFGNYIHAEEQNAHFAPALLKLAQYYMAANELDQAQRRVDVLLADNAKDPENHALLAALDLRRQQYPETEQEVRVALATDPANVSAYSVLIGLYVARNDEHKAIQAIDEGIAKNPRSVDLQQLKLAVYQKSGNTDKMREALIALIKLRPQDVDYRAGLADIDADAGRLDQAEAIWKEGISASPKDWGVKQHYVDFLAQRKGLDAAEAEVNSYIALFPDNDGLYFWLANLYVRFKAEDRAIALLNKIIDRKRLEPTGLNARTSLAQLSLLHGDRTLAEQLINVVLGKDPSNAQALFLRAQMSFDARHYPSAVSDLRSILRIKPGDQEALNLLAETLVRQQRLDLAMETLGQLSDIDPLNFAARVRLAQLRHITGDNQRADEILAAVIKTSPEYPIAWETKARMAIDTKDWPAARDAITALGKLPEQQETAQYLDGVVLDATGKSDEALQTFEAVAKAHPNSPLGEHAIDTALHLAGRANRLDATLQFVESLGLTNNSNVALWLAEAYAQQGKVSQAAAKLDAAIAANSDFATIYAERAQLYLHDKQPDQAIEILVKGRERAVDKLALGVMQSEVLTDQGRYGETIGLLTQLLAESPESDLIANNLASLIADHQYGDQASLEKARQAADRFQGTSNPLLLDTVAWVYYRLDNVPQALTLIERIPNADHLPQQIHYHYGAILLKAGRKDQAKRELQDALADPASTYAGVEDARKLLGTL
ncbi:MAG TPA: tetratricopeptide repeat protein [Candidatus Sulfotelmatobacter sp.]|jgi:tetratricopeptide (TPR) repeat protein|nr:tetratricopeptide repeat protein [Candidatus Sulfotelmatobacter sp.]